MTTATTWPPAAASRRPELPAITPAGQPPAQRRALLEVLTVAGCPNRDAAIAMVHRVCAELGSNAEVRVIEIPDQQAAEQARFLGCSTIRVDGCDVEPDADRCVEYICSCRLYQGQHSLRGLPEEAWVRQALQDAQARRREPDQAALDAESAAFLDQAAAAEEIGAKLNRLLFDFLEAEVLPQAMRAAELGIDPTPLLEVVATVLRIYADGLERPGHARTDHARRQRQ
jgi:hypothetical protein